MIVKLQTSQRFVSGSKIQATIPRPISHLCPRHQAVRCDGNMRVISETQIRTPAALIVRAHNRWGECWSWGLMKDSLQRIMWCLTPSLSLPYLIISLVNKRDFIVCYKWEILGELVCSTFKVQYCPCPLSPQFAMSRLSNCQPSIKYQSDNVRECGNPFEGHSTRVRCFTTKRQILKHRNSEENFLQYIMYRLKISENLDNDDPWIQSLVAVVPSDSQSICIF